MTQKSWFFNSAPNDPRIYQASDFAQYFGKVLSTGLLHVDEVPGLQVKADGTDLRTYVESGGAIMEGYAYENTEDEYLTHSLPEVSLDRIDRIVLRLDKKNANRYIRLFVREGEPSTEPVAPTLQRDNLVWELSLAQVRIRANTSTINPSDVFDERLDRTVCGLVFSLISKPAMADIQTGGYAVTATVEGQTDFEIPLQSFDKVGDGLTVFVGGKKAEYSSYQVLYPRTVRFNVGLPINTKVEFEIIRGVLKLEDDYVVNAGEVGIIDSGNFYESENVEGALQKIGQSLFKHKPTIYGFEIDESNSNPVTSITYIEDALNLNIVNPTDWDNYWPFNEIKPCLVQPSTNQFVCYLNSKNYAQREDGTPVDIASLFNGDVFMEIPTIWWNISRVGSKIQFRISKEKVDNSWVSLAHSKGNNILSKIYLGVFLSHKDANDRLRSLSAKTPTVFDGSVTPSTIRGFAGLNNVELANYYQRFMLPSILFMLRFKRRDTQNVLGEGLGSLSPTGSTNNLGLYSVNTAANNDRTKFLGCEDVFVSIQMQDEFIEGAFSNFLSTPNTRVLKIATENYADENSYKAYDITDFKAGYFTSTLSENEFALIGKNANGSSSTYYCAESKSGHIQAGDQLVGVGFKSLFNISLPVVTNSPLRARICYRPLTPIN